jgi:16S rRNA (guanine527-N7)-methyltransferase
VLEPRTVPGSARTVFGAQLPLAVSYAELLGGAGVARGLLGPREVPRLWERHLLNCAVVSDLLPDGARVVDVGSGAGLPGIPMALRRPDLRVDLVESLDRRVRFLHEVVGELGLDDRVRVVRGRAEEPATGRAVGGADWVTARAVAPLDRLVRWCLPLLADGGTLLAIKGERAESELAAARATVRRARLETRVLVCGAGLLAEPTSVVSVRRRRQSADTARGKDAG